MDTSRHDRVSQLAYGLWQKEGSPAGRDQEFWERAEAMERDAAKPGVSTPLQERSESEKKVDKAMEQSFPASDPPAFAATTGAGVAEAANAKGPGGGSGKRRR